MYTKLNTQNHKIFFVSILSAIILIFSSLGFDAPLVHAQEGTPPPRKLQAVTVLPEAPQEQGKYYRFRTLTLSNGTLVTEHTINGPSTPPAGFEEEQQAVSMPQPNGVSANIIGPNGGPLYLLGCSPTAAADIVKRDERSGEFPNIYPGTLPPDGSSGTFTDNHGDTYYIQPLIASQLMMQQLWDFYQSTAPDPVPGGTPEVWGDTVGGYMRSSQYSIPNFNGHNYDGDTKFYTNASVSPNTPGLGKTASVILPRPFTSDQAAAENLPDGTYGMELFYKARGYAVSEAYNQPTDNAVAGGFSFNQFKAEIDADRPVMIHLGGQANTPGHSVVGVAYDAASNLVYIHDGWDTNTHSMPWGGSYANMPMFMVSIIHPIPPAHPGDYTISGYVGVPNATITYPGGLAKADNDGYYSISVSPSWTGRLTPSKPGYTFQPQYKDYSNMPDYQTKQNYTASLIQGSNLVQDPSFELSSPSWIGSSTNFGNPLCDATCGPGARTGSIWAWFGGTANNEIATLSQTMTIPRGAAASLDFYLWLSDADAGSNTADVFTVTVDGTTLFTANATQLIPYATYVPVSVDVSAYANAAQHTITFGSVTTGQVVSFFLDDVSLAIAPLDPRTISGNAGIAGATLHYTDSTAKTTVADSSGNYSISVPLGWSGTVTPTKAGYKFTPINRSYSNIQDNLTAENYIAQAYIAGSDTTGVFRPSNGVIFLKNSNTTGIADIGLNYGIPGDYPVVGDWDGDGTVTIGVYRNGSFYLRNENTIGFAEVVFPFGQPGDQPVAGDWDGDGMDTIGVYRPSNGQFLLRNSNVAGTADTSFFLGNVGDVGIAGDWNGDGLDTTGVFRPSNGVIFLKNSNMTGFADVALNYGIPGDKPVTGDWNNDGADTIGVYRNGQFLLRNSNTVGFADIVFGLGNPGDMPIAGDWDGLP